MSFFPSADPEEEQTPHAESQSCFTTQHTTNWADADVFDEFTLHYASTTHGLPSHQPTIWAPPVQEPQGLGLQYSVAGFVPEWAGSTTVSQPPTSFTWPADFTPTQTPATSMQPFRRDSCGTDCEQPPTVEPSRLWEPFQSAPRRDICRDLSPGRSEYSASSYHSTASSPFVHSDNYGPANGSPLVKIESEPIMQSAPLFQGMPSLQEPPAIEAYDFAEPTVANSKRSLHPGHTPTCASDAGDVKPTLRPNYRRAHSATDERDAQFMSRRKRSLTRPENANCSCEICGKLFQRCYNLKAHMETHDTNRSMPHKCKYTDCGKRFVRRTDLIRHTESVHIRSRPYSCTRCHNTFARKDTLQRHVEDGCPMRPEMKKRAAKMARSRASPPIKQEPMPRTPESHPAMSPAAIQRLRRS